MRTGPRVTGQTLSTMSGCPVDHSSSQADNKASSTWSRFFSYKSSSNVALSTQRETSSIPNASDAKWVYPSEAQFFAAMARKNYNPQAADMKTIVPIHNAVNERAWDEILKWETGRGGEACGGVRLVNFKGRPNDRTLRARCKVLLGCVTLYLFYFSTAHGCKVIPLRSTGMIGWLIAVVFEHATSSIFTLGTVQARRPTCRFTSMFVRPWTTGRVSK
jgi:Cytochrome c/c1 heme lyase